MRVVGIQPKETADILPAEDAERTSAGAMVPTACKCGLMESHLAVGFSQTKQAQPVSLSHTLEPSLEESFPPCLLDTLQKTEQANGLRLVQTAPLIRRLYRLAFVQTIQVLAIAFRVLVLRYVPC